MKNYVDFNKFREDVIAALKDVEEKHRVKLSAGNISYDNDSFTMQLKAVRTDKDVDKARFMSAVDLMKNLYHKDFREEDYLSTVKIDKHQYTITGFKPGNKYDVIVEREDGKGYCFTSDAVLKALGR